MNRETIEPNAGSTILVRAIVSDDGRTVRIAPGVELPWLSVEIEAEIPREVAGLTPVLIYVADEAERQELLAYFTD